MNKLIAKIILFLGLLLPNVNANEIPRITVVSTHLTQNSALFDYLLPEFGLFSGVRVNLITKNTDEAIALAQSGGADVLIIDNAEKASDFVKMGYATKYFNLMYNDFVLVGPANDPAKITADNNIDVKLAFRKIAAIRSKFISRGDNSPNHIKEMAIWRDVGIFSPHKSWHLTSGFGANQTIKTAINQNAYTLIDRGSWVSYPNKSGFKIILQGDKSLFNQYNIMVVNDKVHKKVKTKYARKFVDWLLSPRGQQSINNYNINGNQIFVSNYK